MGVRTFTAVLHKENDLYVADCPEVGTASAGWFLARKTELLSGRAWRQHTRLLGLRLVGHLYPKPPGPTTPPHSILLIRPDHLGDMLFLTPALHALRTALPDARITLLAGPWGQGVMQNNPALDTIVTCRFPGFERQPKTSALAPYRLLRQMARDLRRGGYDTAVILRFDHWWGAWLAAAAGIPRRVGYAWPETVPFLTETVSYLPGRHEVEQDGTLLAVLSPGSAQRLGPTRYVVAQTDRDWADAWLRGHGVNPKQRLVAIHPGAGAAVKQWPVASWAEVADRLIEDSGVQVLLTGSTGERSLTQTLADAMAHPVLDAAGETSLGQLAALQARCALVLGSDCGPLHLAVAVDVPTVHLYGPVASGKFGPWGDPARHVVLTTNWPCAPCNRLDWPAEVLAQHACMAAITPQEVLATAETLLGKPRVQPGP